MGRVAADAERAGAERAARRPRLGPFGRATLATATAVAAVATVGTFYGRGWGRVPFSVPSPPWYSAVPFYIFPGVQPVSAWAALTLPVILGAVIAVVALHRSRARWPLRVAVSAGLLFVLALAVAATTGGPRAWRAPFEPDGEYPNGVALVRPLASFLGDFPELVPRLPFHAQGHPAGAMVLYDLLARVWPGLDGAAVLTVAVGCLGAAVAGGFARDELGEPGGRLALALWVLSPVVVLYTATSADAVFAVVLGGAALTAHRGLLRRSTGWTILGGTLLWAASMLTYSAALLLVFLLVRAASMVQGQLRWVAGWAALTSALVLGLAGLLWWTTGHDPVAALRAVHRAYAAAPGSAGRPYLLWLAGDPVAFGGMLGVPLLAALTARAVAVVRARAWTSIDAAALACLLAASAWGFSKGEVERIFLFLVPLVLVPVTRQLLTWRVRLPAVATLLLAQTLLVQSLFSTRW